MRGSAHAARASWRRSGGGGDETTSLGCDPVVCTRKVPSCCGDGSPRQASSSQLRRHSRVTAQDPDATASETRRLEAARIGTVSGSSAWAVVPAAGASDTADKVTHSRLANAPCTSRRSLGRSLCSHRPVVATACHGLGCCDEGLYEGTVVSSAGGHEDPAHCGRPVEFKTLGTCGEQCRDTVGGDGDAKAGGDEHDDGVPVRALLHDLDVDAGVTQQLCVHVERLGSR